MSLRTSLSTAVRCGGWIDSASTDPSELTVAWEPDVVYVWNPQGLRWAMVRGLARRNPIVFSVADHWLKGLISGTSNPDPLRQKLCGLIRRSRLPLAPGLLARTGVRGLRRAWFHFDSEFLSDSTLETSRVPGFTPRKHNVIPHPVADEFFAARPALAARSQQGQPVTLLYVGRLAPGKGIETLIAALRILNDGVVPYHLSLFGDGDPASTATYRAEVKRLGLDEVVAFHGLVTPERLIAAHHISEVFVFPSEWTEPFGISLAEAMAACTPIVSSATGGARWVAPPGDCSRGFRPGDAQSLAEQVRAVIDRPAETQRLVDTAHARAEGLFRMATVTDRIEAVLAAAVSAAPLTSSGRR